MKPCYFMMGISDNLHEIFDLDGGECNEREGIAARMRNYWFQNEANCEIEAGYATFQEGRRGGGRAGGGERMKLGSEASGGREYLVDRNPLSNCTNSGNLPLRRTV